MSDIQFYLLEADVNRQEATNIAIQTAKSEVHSIGKDI